MLARVMSADMEELRRKGGAVADLLTASESAHITCPNGTDFRLGLGDRVAIPDAGELGHENAFGNLPCGEGFIAPIEGSCEGTLVVDGTIAGVGIPAEPVRMTVVDGRLADATGPEGAALLELLRAHGDVATTVAELGIGTNEKAELTGNVLEDEKILGTVHIAFGASAAIGGTVQVPVHLDCVVMKPTIDGRRDDGRLRGRLPALTMAEPDRVQPLLAVPNFSAGPNSPALGAIGAELRSAAAVLDLHADAIHNRSVFSLAAAADRPAGRARGRRRRSDRRDRPARARRRPPADRGDRRLSRRLLRDPAPARRRSPSPAEVAARLARARAARLPLRRARDRAPSASSATTSAPAASRRSAPRMAAGELVPDFGPAEPHPSAGATLVTARPPLAAFNVELAGPRPRSRPERSRAALRESGGGLAGVRAIAIALSPETVQISTNVHDPVSTTLAAVVAEIERLAAEAGGRAEAAELIGLIPEAALRDYPEHVPIRDFDPGSRTIEARLAEVL